MGGSYGNRLTWVAAAALVLLTAWWLLIPPPRPGPARTTPSTAVQPPVPAPDAEGRGSGTRTPESESVRSQSELRRSAPPARAALSARHGAALKQLREGGDVRETQGALLALLHPYTSEGPLRDGLAILGGRPDQLQRDVFQALRTRLRPEVLEALQRLSAHDPSPQVRRAAGLALEVAEDAGPSQ